jgi:serine/threonine protein kinase
VAEIGQVIAGRYRLLELRGEDSISTVFRATDARGNRVVAVKILHPQFAADPDFIAEFRLQMRAAAALSHPNILTIYDFGTDPGPYIVSEYFDGQDLGSLLSHNGAVPPRRAANVGGVVAGAVASAHERGVVHGGLRSSSVLVTRDGTIKVADFGLARVIADAPSPVEDRFVDEACYMSPEQVRGRRATDASDIYALGVLLFELLTGRVPWDGETAAEIFAARRVEPIPQPSDYQAGIPAEIEAIEQRAVAIDPTSRFESATDMANSLEDTIAALDAMYTTTPPAADDEAETETTAQSDDMADTIIESVVPPRVATPVYRAAVPPVAVPPTAPIVPSRRPNPTARVNYSADAYVQPEGEPVAASSDQAQSGYSPDGAARRATRRINPVEAEPETYDEVTPVSAWAWVAGFLALFLVTLLGLTIFLWMNKNAPANDTVAVPDLVNLQYAQAQQLAQGVGLEIQPIYQPNNTKNPDNTVVSQDPSAGSFVNKGDTIKVTVVTGVPQVVVPTVRNLTESEALNALASVGLTAGNRTEAYDPTIPEGQIVSTNPRDGLSVLKGSSVDYVVSKGPEPTPTPTPSPTPSPLPTLAPTATPTAAPTPTPAPTATP